MSHEVAETNANMQEITRLRAELDTLRNGVVWLAAELDRAKRWAALWKRAAKGQWNRAWRQDAEAALLDMRALPDTENPQ